MFLKIESHLFSGRRQKNKNCCLCTWIRYGVVDSLWCCVVVGMEVQVVVVRKGQRGCAKIMIFAH